MTYPVMPGVPAAGHVTRGGAWHPGSGTSCRRCAPEQLVRRPRPGDRIQSRYGDVLVLTVGQHGRQVTVRDAIGRQWTLDRDPAGWWRRAR